MERFNSIRRGYFKNSLSLWERAGVRVRNSL
jgi:hypothetical protein